LTLTLLLSACATTGTPSSTYQTLRPSENTVNAGAASAVSVTVPDSSWTATGLPAWATMTQVSGTELRFDLTLLAAVPADASSASASAHLVISGPKGQYGVQLTAAFT